MNYIYLVLGFLSDMLDRIITHVAIWNIQRLYGRGCRTWDFEDNALDMPELASKDINETFRCPTCASNQVVIWLRNHLNYD